MLSAVFGILIGIAAAWRRRSATDYTSTTVTMATYSMPDFWAGMLLLSLFGVTLGWFPIGGLQDPTSDATGLALLGDQIRHMFLPALTLTIAYLGEYALVMRASLLDTMREDYLTLARAKGLRDIKVRNRHAVPNALLPVVTLAAINFGFILSGAIAVETIFSWPGLGFATYEAIHGPDLPMLQGLFLFFSASVILFNFLADLLYAVPRPAGADRMSAAAATGRPAAHRLDAPAPRARLRLARPAPRQGGDGRADHPHALHPHGRLRARCSPTRTGCGRSTRSATTRG